jgi:hypothetical protein
MEIVALFAMVVCAIAIYISIKIYRETPKIDKKLEEEMKRKKQDKYRY